MKSPDQMVLDGIEQMKLSTHQLVRTLEARGESRAALEATSAIDALDRCVTELRAAARMRRSGTKEAA